VYKGSLWANDLYLVMNTGSNDQLPLQLPAPPEMGGMGQMPLFEEEEAPGIDVRRYLNAIRRHKWMVIGLALLGLSGGTGATFVVKPVYEAQAAVQLVTGDRSDQRSPIASAPLLQGTGWQELMRSFAVLDAVVRRHRLYLEFATASDAELFREFELSVDFVPDEYIVVPVAGGRVRLERRNGEIIEEVAVGDSLGKSQGFIWVAPQLADGRTVAFRIRQPRDAAVQLDKDLVANVSRDGAFMRVSYRSTSPEVAKVIVNDVVQRFEEVATQLKRAKLTSFTSVLREQLANARVELANAEIALQSYKVQTITLPNDRGANPIASGLLETQAPVRQAYFKLRTDREDLARDRDAIARVLEQPASQDRSLALALAGIVSARESSELSGSLTQLTAKRSELLQLRTAFAPGHPQIRAIERQIAIIEGEDVPRLIRSVLVNLDQRIADLDQRIGASSREMQEIPIRATEESRRERNVQIAQQIYTSLQSAFESSRLTEMSAAPDVRSLDSAVQPTKPVRDQIVMIVGIGLLAGLALGIGGAIVLDIFDNRIRYPDQITRDLGLPILGTLPMLTQQRSGRVDPDDLAHLLEAVRGIRMSLLYSHGSAGPFTTTVTSPGPGDGKSFTSANLARGFASSGRRTILIDGDNRRGVLHRTLGVDRRPGLTDWLTGKASIEEIVRRIPDTQVDFIPCGTRLAAAPELLASPEMQRLMMELRTRYQAIVIDSPPLGAGIDALVLGSLTGSMLMVLRNGVTDREFAGARLEAIQRLPIRMLGAVLNDVQATDSPYYRQYAYLPGYRSEDEDVGQVREEPLTGLR
jgi:succinoglycan biosynthesis transport protein ExoP